MKRKLTLLLIAMLLLVGSFWVELRNFEHLTKFICLVIAVFDIGSVACSFAALVVDFDSAVEDFGAEDLGGYSDPANDPSKGGKP